MNKYLDLSIQKKICYTCYVKQNKKYLIVKHVGTILNRKGNNTSFNKLKYSNHTIISSMITFALIQNESSIIEQ